MAPKLQSMPDLSASLDNWAISQCHTTWISNCVLTNPLLGCRPLPGSSPFAPVMRASGVATINARRLRGIPSQGRAMQVTRPCSTYQGMSTIMGMPATTGTCPMPLSYNAHHTIRYQVHAYKFVPWDPLGKSERRP